MGRNISGVYSLPPGTTVTNGDTSDATDVNAPFADLAADANIARPVVAGGTGASSASAARTNLGLAIGTDVQAQSALLQTISTQGDVRAADIAADAITTDKILDANVTTAKIADDAVTFAKLAEAPETTLTDDDTKLATSGGVFAKVDGGTAGPTAASGASAVEFGTLPADVTEIEFNFGQLSLSGTDGVLVQLSTSSAYVETGYLSTQSDFGATSSASSGSTTGFALVVGVASAQLIGKLSLVKTPGTNTWTATGVCRRDNARTNILSGEITLAGVLDGIRIVTSGANTFDGGSPWISYKARSS